MTIMFYRSHKECADNARDINLRYYGGQPVQRCLRVQITDLKKANDCGLRPMPIKSKVKKGSRGYVSGQNIDEFKGCGLKPTKRRRR